MEQADLLGLWRTRLPNDDPEAPVRVSAALLARARTLPDGLAMTALVLRAEARDRLAWVMLAAMLPRRLGYADASTHLVAIRDMEELDLEGSCLWVAASLGLPWAYTVLAFRLLRLARENDGESGAAYQALAARYAHVGDIESPAPVDAASELGILSEIVTPPSPPASAAPAITQALGADWAPQAAEGPTLRVLATSPPPAASREDRALIERYADLARPLPLAPMPDPNALAMGLLAEFPWMPEVVEAVRRELVLGRRLGSDAFQLSPLLLTGPSGVGKSRFARRLAALAGIPVGMLIAAGASDSRALAGTARGWSTTQPCLPLMTIRNHEMANPIIIVDGIDDAGGSAQGGAINRTMLGMLDPAMARAWPDECLLVPADLSWVSWILIARRADRVPADLRARCRVVEAGWPRPGDFNAILQGALADIASGYGRKAEDLPVLEAEIVEALRTGFVTGRLQARQLTAVVRRALAAAADVEWAAPRH